MKRIMKDKTKTTKLKDSVKIWANDRDGLIPCILAAIVMKKKWRNPDKKYKSINQAVMSFNRAWNNIDVDKSSNIYSAYQQSFCNKWNKDRSIKYRSKRKLSELDTLNCDWNKYLKDINTSGWIS